MENLITIKNDYNSLDTLHKFLNTASSFGCSKEYDTWEMRTNTNNQMEQCLVLKKCGMHAVKLYFINENTVKVNHIIPSKMMHAYFGKSVKARRNILELIAGGIKELVLAGPQQKAFDTLETIVKKASL